MQGAVVRGQRGPLWGTPPTHPLLPKEARVRVLLAGICRTDLYAAEGVLSVADGRVLGHEFVGEISEIDAHAPFSAGTRVTANPLLPCGTCPGCIYSCTCDQPNMLGVDLDGAFAHQVQLPWTALHAVPTTLSLRRAAYVEPVAASLAVFKAPITPAQQGLLLGTNRIAMLTRRLLEARGFRHLTQCTLDDEIPKNSFDFAIETVPTEAALQTLMLAVRPGGCILLKSRPPHPVAINLALAVRRDLRLYAVGYGSFIEAISILQELPIDDFLGDVFPLHRFAEAFALAHDSESSKLFLEPS